MFARNCARMWTDLITAHAETDTLENQTENHVDRFLESSHICFSVTGEYKASLSFNRLLLSGLSTTRNATALNKQYQKVVLLQDLIIILIMFFRIA